MRWFAPVNLPIGVHWHHYNGLILPPIIEQTNNLFSQEAGDPESIQDESVQDNHVLVYFPFQSLQNLMQLVRPFKDYQFYIYHPVQAAFDDEHIHVRPLSRVGFQKELHKTSGVICGAGFELPSEALSLGKKLMVQPVGGQMEQLSNAKTLADLSLAKVCQQFNAHDLEEWLYHYPAKQFNFPDTAAHIVHWIKQNDLSDPKGLVNYLWENVQQSAPRPLYPAANYS